MRPAALALLAWAALLAVAATSASASAEPPTGIVRPENENAYKPRELGAQLYGGNCSSCHGSGGSGVTRPPQRGAGDIKGQAPPLRGVGALAADFYLRTGYMPLANPQDQPWPNRDLWTKREQRALTAYIASLAPGPGIPHPDPSSGSVSNGQRLFTEHCAGCHQVAAAGGIVTGARVPSLENLDPVEIAEAVRIGPFVMPTFSQTALSDQELNSVIAYIKSADKQDRGGWGIGRLGPIPEGMVTWFVAAVVLVALCMVIGTRLGDE